MIKVTLGNNVKRESKIIEASTTLRAALEAAGVDYTRGVMHLDGSSLQAGDLDRTFADFGITEKCYLLNVVKADNAAGVTAVGQAIVIKSSLTLDDIKMVEKYRPKALVLMGGEDNKEEIFAISSKGDSISAYGISFSGSSRDEEGFATLTITTDFDGDGMEDFIADKYGAALINLAKLEESIPAVVEEIKAEREAIKSLITLA